MAIHIKTINAKGLGPLDEFKQDLKLVNLIYGHNEHGKTFLVEFLIRALFDNHKIFKLRDLSPTGKVSISGLSNDEIEFSPNSRNKLDKYLLDFDQGLPTDYSKLLVVKGAELDLDPSISEGMDKNSIKAFLSSEGVLNNIQNKISSTIQNASIENGIIQGYRRGSIKTREDLKATIEQLTSLYEDITNKVSASSYSRFRNEELNLNEQIKLQENAKQHLAFKNTLIRNEKQKKHDEFNFNNFEELKINHQEYRRLKVKQQQIQKDLNEAKEKSENYLWLKNSLVEYERLSKSAGGYAKNSFWKWLWFGVGLFSVVVGAALSFLDQLFIFCIVPGLISLIISAFLFFRLEKAKNSDTTLQVDLSELEKLRTEFSDKRKSSLSSKTSIITAIEEEAQYFPLVKKYEDDLNENNLIISDIRSKVEIALRSFDSFSDDEDKWGSTIDALEREKANLDIEIRELDNMLNRLNIPENLHRETFDGPDYNEELLNDLKLQKELVKEQINQEDSELKIIKNTAISILQLHQDPTWEDILGEILKRISAKKAEYKVICSEIVSGFIVNKVINEIKLHEDEKIKNALSLPNITNPIMDITSKYEGIDLRGDKIIVKSKFEDFPLGDLSTGAREQILLGIRLGLISRLFGNNQGFLILDDAFQHSDYKRREKIIEKMFNLANNKWQIIYFSMDDHIASLFDKYGKKLGKEYLRVNL